MGIQVGRWSKWITVTLTLAVTSAPSIAQSQSCTSQTTPNGDMSPSDYSAPTGLTGDDIISKMAEHNRLRSEQLQWYSAVRTYEIRNLEGKLAAQSIVRVKYQAPDKKSFDKTSEQGSRIVRHLVFDRLLESERETSSGREHHDSAITPANYNFTFVGEEESVRITVLFSKQLRSGKTNIYSKGRYGLRGEILPS